MVSPLLTELLYVAEDADTFLTPLQGADLRNASVTLKLYWDHMPLTGTLFMHNVSVDTFKVPGEYKRR